MDLILKIKQKPKKNDIEQKIGIGAQRGGGEERSCLSFLVSLRLKKNDDVQRKRMKRSVIVRKID